MGLVGQYVSDGQRLLHHTWYVTLAFASILSVGCIAVAAQRNIISNTNKAAGFAAIWSMFVMIATSFYGTLTLNKVSKNIIYLTIST